MNVHSRNIQNSHKVKDQECSCRKILSLWREIAQNSGDVMRNWAKVVLRIAAKPLDVYHAQKSAEIALG